MDKYKITLKEAIRFHGHLGPYLILGILAGEFALKKLRAKKYFGLAVKVYGANKKPKSCFIDGLQLSTGATYGKGNIQKMNGNKIKIWVKNSTNNKKIELNFKEDVITRLEALKGHRDSERFARGLLNVKLNDLFELKF